jgi:cyclic pyranopterin phosphate synthase
MDLSHLDEAGRPRMVDVGGKAVVHRRAVAEGRIALRSDTVRLIRAARIAKGGVLSTAELAGVQAAKRTGELIPLCHPLPLDCVRVTATLGDDGVQIEAEARCTGRTGVEMEALTAVGVALLTVYDMCKAVDQEMSISGIRLREKTKTPLPPTADGAHA